MEHTDKTYVAPRRKTSGVRHRSNDKSLKPSPAKNARTNKIMYHHQGASSYFCMATQWGSGCVFSRACLKDEATYGPQKKMQCAIRPPMASELVNPDQALEPVK